MMIESDNKSRDNDNKPVERNASAKTVSKQQQDGVDFTYHSLPPLVDRIEINLALSAKIKNLLFYQREGIGGCSLKLLTGFDLFNQNRDHRIPF